MVPVLLFQPEAIRSTLLQDKPAVSSHRDDQSSVIELITYGTMFESTKIILARIFPADISHFILGNSTILAG
jgi:hypothetical protein